MRLFQYSTLSNYGLNYGIIILILTILLKIVLFPIPRFISFNRKNARFETRNKEINKKYSTQGRCDKKTAGHHGLIQKSSVNPLSGCLPMLLQFPILIAMFSSSLHLSIEQQPFLWLMIFQATILYSTYLLKFLSTRSCQPLTLLMTVATLFYTKSTMI